MHIVTLTAQTLSEFWLGVEREYQLIGQRAVHILLPFATSYLCEIGFSAVATLKTRYRSRLNIEYDLRVALSSMQPRFEKMCVVQNRLVVRLVINNAVMTHSLGHLHC